MVRWQQAKAWDDFQEFESVRSYLTTMLIENLTIHYPTVQGKPSGLLGFKGTSFMKSNQAVRETPLCGLWKPPS